ncbi:MAG: hypothetical protein M3P98_02790 [bacterium]|nr:hypothetical protein [bacterium]
MNNDLEKKDQDFSKWLIPFAFAMPSIMFGIIGALVGYFDKEASVKGAFTGFIWGFGVGVAISVICFAWIYIWKWLKDNADKGKLFPYILGGIAAGIIISGYIAISFGKPSCDEYDGAPYNSCISYDDNGFEPSSDQQISKFWSTLPVAMIITILISIIVHSYRKKE